MSDKTLKILKDDLVKDAELIGAPKTEKDMIGVVDKLMIGAEGAVITRRYSLACYLFGKAGKGNASPSVNASFDTFNSKMRGPNTGRKPLAKSSYDTMQSYYNAWSELGFVKGWDTAATFAWCLDNIGALPYSKRGGFIREVVALTEEPTPERLAEMLAAKIKAPELPAIAAGIVKGVKGIGDKHPSIAAVLRAEGPRHKALAQLILAANNFEAVCKQLDGGGNADGDDWLSDVMADAA